MNCLLSFLPGECGVSFVYVTVNFKCVQTKPKSHSKLASRQSHASAKKKIWKVVKRVHVDGDKTKPLNCRREFVDAYRNKPTAKKKDSTTAKRLHLDVDKTKPSRLPSAGMCEQTFLALIRVFCFASEMRFCFLLPLWAKESASPRHERRNLLVYQSTGKNQQNNQQRRSLNLHIRRTLRCGAPNYKCPRQNFFVYQSAGKNQQTTPPRGQIRTFFTG